MHDVADLLWTLSSRGVRLWVEDGQLRFQAPRGVLNQETLDSVRACRLEIMNTLERMQPPSEEVALAPRQSGCPVPVTPTQRHWWKYVQDHQAGQTQRLCHVSMRIMGRLDRRALFEGVSALVRRHEPLRSRIVAENGSVEQRIDINIDPAYEVIDLSGSIDAEANALRLGEQFLGEDLTLAVGPLFAARLFKLSCREHVLILALEHAISDGVSNNILHSDLWTLYGEVVVDGAASLPTPPLQFGDYAVWQERTYESWLAAHGSFWKARLARLPELALPFDYAASERPAYAVQKTSFGSTLTSRLRDVARRERVALAAAVLSVYVAVIAQWSKQQDLLVKFVSNARNRPELQRMVGFLASCLNLRFELREDDDVLRLMHRVDRELRCAQEHADFDRVLDLVPQAVTPFSFNWVPVEWVPAAVDHPGGAGGTLHIRPFPLELPWQRDFLPVFFDTPATIVLSLTYRSDLFAAATIEQLSRSLMSRAAQLVQDSRIGVPRHR